METSNLEPYDQKYFKLIVYLEKIQERVEKEILQKELSDTDTQKLLLLSLMLSIMELSKSAIELLNSKTQISIPSIVRNMLEAHVDLRNLIINSDYKVVMYTSYLTEQKRLLENQENRTELERKMLDYVNYLYEKFKENIVKTKLSSRFNSVGLQQMYHSTYNRLCRETHNNINCLIQRHFDNKNELEKLEYLRKKELNEIAFYIYTIIDILHKSLVSIGQFFKFKRSKNLNEIIGLKKLFKEEFDDLFNEMK